MQLRHYCEMSRGSARNAVMSIMHALLDGLRIYAACLLLCAPARTAPTVGEAIGIHLPLLQLTFPGRN